MSRKRTGKTPDMYVIFGGRRFGELTESPTRHILRVTVGAVVMLTTRNVIWLRMWQMSEKFVQDGRLQDWYANLLYAPNFAKQPCPAYRQLLRRQHER